jgi:hypothetical protein
MISSFQADLVRHPLLYPLLRNESAACLRASPPKQRRVEGKESSRREEQAQMISALARALQAVRVRCLYADVLALTPDKQCARAGEGSQPSQGQALRGTAAARDMASQSHGHCTHAASHLGARSRRRSR